MWKVHSLINTLTMLSIVGSLMNADALRIRYLIKLTSLFPKLRHGLWSHHSYTVHAVQQTHLVEMMT